MKKSAFIILFAALSFCAGAKTVSIERARNYAADFLCVSASSLTATVSTDEFFVFNCADGGWAMISAEDAVTPVLAYSHEGRFVSEGMPENVRWWFNGVAGNIRTVRKEGLVQNERVAMRWTDPSFRTKTAVDGGKLLKTAQWGQESPFWKNCPKYKGSYCLVGCVATAMSIYLRYLEWPARPHGTTPEYTTYTLEIDVPSLDLDQDSHIYDWENMPLEAYNSHWTEAQKTAVARLCADCGTMVQMDYDPEGSGAYDPDIPVVLLKYMYFQGGRHYFTRDNFSTADWVLMLENEIDADYPVIYSGSDDSDGGHCFIVDGYDENDMFHVNWGWDGYDTGYCAIDMECGDDYIFDQGQSAIIGLRPDKSLSTDNSEDPELVLGYYSKGKNTYQGLELTSGTVAPGKKAVFSVGIIWNMNWCGTDNMSYKGIIKMGLCDYNYNFKSFVSDDIDCSEGLDGGYGASASDVECNIPADVVLGDRLTLYYCLSDGSWVRMPYDNVNTVGEYAIWDAPFIAAKPEYQAGERLYFQLVPGRKCLKTLTWFYDGVVNSDPAVKLTRGTHTVKAEAIWTDGTTESIVQEITVN